MNQIIPEKNSVVDVLDVAKYILKNKGGMSVWKLQKLLCYYAQA